jgi:hypothetical protein
LTKKGEKPLTNRIARVHLILYAHTCDFETATFHRYPDPTIGQYASHAIIYLLLKYGQESRPTSFYAATYLQLFPFLIEPFETEHYSTPMHQFQNCFTIRAFKRFNDWWGFTETETKWFGIEMFTYVQTQLSKVFEFNRN